MLEGGVEGFDVGEAHGLCGVDHVPHAAQVQPPPGPHLPRPLRRRQELARRQRVREVGRLVVGQGRREKVVLKEHSREGYVSGKNE